MAKGNQTKGSGAHVDPGVALGETLPGESSPAASASSRSSGDSWIEGLPGDLADLHPGSALEHFFVLGKLGSGGMGVVLSAYDPDLDRKVAIKVLPQSRINDASYLERFHQEAQAVALLENDDFRVMLPEAVPVNDAGISFGQVIEYGSIHRSPDVT